MRSTWRTSRNATCHVAEHDRRAAGRQADAAPADDRLHVGELGEHAGELARRPTARRAGAGDLERAPLGLVDLEHRRRDRVPVLGREAELAPVDEPVPAGVHPGQRARVGPCPERRSPRHRSALGDLGKRLVGHQRAPLVEPRLERRDVGPVGEHPAAGPGPHGEPVAVEHGVEVVARVRPRRPEPASRAPYPLSGVATLVGRCIDQSRGSLQSCLGDAGDDLASASAGTG